jgi:hypothetical protein
MSSVIDAGPKRLAVPTVLIVQQSAKFVLAISAARRIATIGNAFVTPSRVEAETLWGELINGNYRARRRRQQYPDLSLHGS